MTWQPHFEDKDRPGLPIRFSLDKLAARLGSPSSDTVSAVFSKWDEAVGVEIAEHVHPQSISDGVLLVEVDDGRWIAQLKWLTPKILTRLSEILGSNDIKSIEPRLKRYRR